MSSDGTTPQGPAWVHDLARVRALQAATAKEDPHYWAISLRLLQLIELALDTDDTDELLSEAIGNATSLRGIPLDDESLAFVEMSLATNLVERFRRGGQRSDLDAALEIRFARVAAGCPTTVYSDLINLASALLLSWNHTSRVEHLHEVIARLGPACGGDTPGNVKPDVEERVKLAANLATAYGHRFDLQRRPDDLALSITMFRTALTDADPDTAAGLSVNLATGLLDAYRTGLGDSDDLDEAVALIRRATQDDPRVAGRWDALAQALFARYERDGNDPPTGETQPTLDACHDAVTTALELGSEDSPAYGGYLATAATIAYARYHHSGDREELTRAITVASQALTHNRLEPQLTAILANEVCLSRTERFELDGDRGDLDEAIAIGRKALVGELRADIEYTLRTNLANAFNRRYDLDREPEDLLRGIAMIVPTLTRTPPSPERAARLNAAGLLYASKAMAIGPRSDLDRAITYGREAIALTGRSSQDRVIYQVNLAAWLTERATGSDPHATADLDDAIDLLESALGEVAPDSAIRVRILHTLADRLHDRYELRQSLAAAGTAAEPNLDDVQRACDLWDAALACGEPFVTVFAGQRLGNVAFQYELWDQCEQALALSLTAASELAARRPTFADRERARFDVQGTAAVTALAAVRSGNAARAVAHLERASATLLIAASGHSEAVAAGDPIDDVRETAERLGGPLVYCAATQVGGIALVVGCNGTVTPVPLDVTSTAISEVLDDLRHAFDTPGPDPLQRWSEAIRGVRRWTWQQVVKPFVEIVGDAEAITLIPIGRVAWLPLTTAGDGASGLFERTIPSVAPNALSLAPVPPWPSAPQVVVSYHEGSDDRWLPAAADEATRVAGCHQRVRWAPLSGESPVERARPSRPLAGPMAAAAVRTLRRHKSPAVIADDDTEDLLRSLNGTDLAHLTCHVDLDFDRPLSSILHYGRGVSMQSILQRRLPGPVHLVLSGCDAGLTGTGLPDEAIGPASILLAAGARSVTAALWPIDDELAPDFMAAYHAQLATGVQPAAALALAQREAARSQLPVVWPAFVHVGP